jgi:hypothetical protein
MNPRALRHRTLVVLLVLGLALVAPHAPWSGSPRAESDRAAISRSGVLGGARYLIEVPAKWQGGLVVFECGGCIRRRTPDHRARTPCTRNAPVS